MKYLSASRPSKRAKCDIIRNQKITQKKILQKEAMPYYFRQTSYEWIQRTEVLLNNTS